MKPRACTLLIFGLTVASVLDSASEQRDLDVVELWSGVESIVSAARAAGFTAMPFDKFRIEGVTDTDDPETTKKQKNKKQKTKNKKQKTKNKKRKT